MGASAALWLSTVLSALGCSGFVLAGGGRPLGWVIVLIAQPLWAVFAVITRAYGICLTCLLYTGVAVTNLRGARKSRRGVGGASRL